MSYNSNNNDKKGVPFATRRELATAIILGCVNIVIFALLVILAPNVHVAFFAIGLTALYLVEISLIGIKRQEEALVLPSVDIHDMLLEESSIILKNSLSPFMALNQHGIILWYNEAMREALGFAENLIGANVEEYFDTETKEHLFDGLPIKVNGRIYDVEGFSVSASGDGIYVVKLADVTELREANKIYNDERTAVAYIAIDNVEDILQYVHEQFRDSVSTVDETLKSWAAEMNAVIKSYENDKYIMILDSYHLDRCIKNRFSILDKVRETRVGDGISLTISIGVARIVGTLQEKEAAAKDAIDLALQRGGDQAVCRLEDEVTYYGGKTKSVYKRSNVRSRTFTTQLTALMARADNVLVMGHRFGDFDSIGAAVGIARLCMLCGVKTNIAIDKRDRGISSCIEIIENTEGFDNVLVDNAEALDLVGPDTLVILVDHHQTERAQFSNITGKVDNIVVIDHHRTNDLLEPVIKLSYIDGTASSACELVSEMLENAISSQNLQKEVADLLLAGVLLDTKQFTRNTGTRTFAVAQYLRGAGADPQDVNNLFKTTPSDLAKEARFHTAITIYRDIIAISACDGDTDDTFRVIASKAADKMLALRGIQASFALVKINDQIHISGRSIGGVNVKLILEALKGGGHFDVAGAQVRNETIDNVLQTLKASIDSYLDANGEDDED